MRSILIGVLSILALHAITAQEVSFTVEVTNDTIYYGNPVMVRFSMINVQGDFQPPSFEGFDVVSGPNTSSQYSMINGKVTMKGSYEYVLMPTEEGSITIQEADLNTADQVLSTTPVEIVVMDNPDGIVQHNRGYGYKQQIVMNKATKPMTREDSLRIQLRKIKSTKI